MLFFDGRYHRVSSLEAGQVFLVTPTNDSSIGLYRICLFSVLISLSVVPYHFISAIISDCNWGDHVATVGNAFGVIGYRTPSGLQYHEFEAALKKYREHTERRQPS